MARKTGMTSCGVNDGSVQCYSDECTCLEREENVVITDTKTSIIVKLPHWILNNVLNTSTIAIIYCDQLSEGEPGRFCHMTSVMLRHPFIRYRRGRSHTLGIDEVGLGCLDRVYVSVLCVL